jgi:hypothetical protein
MKQLLAFAFTLVSTYCHAQLDKSYSCPEYSVSYPKNWRLDTSRQAAPTIFFFSPLENSQDKFSENVNIMIQNLAGKHIDLSAYQGISENQVSTLGVNGKMIKSKIEKTAQGDRYYMEYQMTMNGNELRVKSICYIKKDIAYLATFTSKTDSFEKYNKTGTEILESFRLK